MTTIGSQGSEDMFHHLINNSMKSKSIKIRCSMASPLSPAAGNVLREIDSTENDSAAFKLLASNQRKAEQLQKLDADYPPIQRWQSKSLPRNAHTGTEKTVPHSAYTSQSLPRKLRNSQAQLASRSRTKSTGDTPSNIPPWYKSMCKKMNTSMEYESQLPKLLTSDETLTSQSKTGSFQSPISDDVPRRLRDPVYFNRSSSNRKSLPNIHASNFDRGDFNKSTTVPTKTPPWYKNMYKEMHTSMGKESHLSNLMATEGSNVPVQSATFEDAPRRILYERSIINRPYRKSLPNIHAANLHFMEDHKCDPNTTRIINSTTSKPDSFNIQNKPKNVQSTRDVPKAMHVALQYTNTGDILEFQEIKDEEALHNQREKELYWKLKQNDRERKSIKQALKLKEEELNRKEEKLRRREAQQNKEERLFEKSGKPKLPPFGRAKYTFYPQVLGELPFKKGDIITLLGAFDEHWMKGEHDGNIGIFPTAYVQHLHNLPIENKVKGNPNIVVEIALRPSKNATICLKDELNPDGHDLKYNKSSRTEGGIHVEKQFFHKSTETSNNVVEKKLNSKNIPHGHISDTDLVDVAISCQSLLESGLAYASYTFKAKAKNELPFYKGDKISILHRVDDNWYEGECNGEVGIFPDTYVKVIREPVLVEANYQDKMPNIEIKNGGLSAYKKGTKKDKEVSSTRMHSENDMNSSIVNDFIGKGVPYKAIYRYSATNEDEIELIYGDIVYVLEKCADKWYIGTSQRTGAFGTFPGNFVKPLK